LLSPHALPHLSVSRKICSDVSLNHVGLSAHSALKAITVLILSIVTIVSPPCLSSNLPAYLGSALVKIKEMIVNTLTPNWPSCTIGGAVFDKELINDRSSSRSQHQKQCGFFVLFLGFLLDSLSLTSATNLRRFFKTNNLTIKVRGRSTVMSQSTSSVTYNPVHEIPYTSQGIDYT